MASSRRSARTRPPVSYAGQQGDAQAEDSDASAQGDDSEEATSGEEAADTISDEGSIPAEPSKKKRKTVKGAAIDATAIPTSLSERPSTIKKRVQPSAKPKSLKRPAGLQNTHLAELEDIDDLIKQDTTLVTSTQTTMEIESDDLMYNLQMFKNVVENLKVTGSHVPTKGDTISLDTLLAGPVLNNNRWTLFTVHGGKGNWQCYLRDHSRPANVSKRVERSQHNETITVPQDDVPEKSTAEQIAKRYCDLMERLPYPVIAPSNGRSDLKAFLLDMVTRSLVPKLKVYVTPSVIQNYRQVKSTVVCYKGIHRGVDPVTGTSFDSVFFVNTTKVDLKKVIPPLPSHVVVKDFKPSGNARTDEEKARERYASDLANHIAYKMHSLCGAREALDVKRMSFMSQFLNMKNIKRGVYGGKCLYRHDVDVRSRSIRITISKAVRDSLKNIKSGHENLPTIIIRGLSTTRAQQVIQIMMQTWMRTGDILETWRAACKTADLLNIAAANGDDLISTCACTTEQSKTQYHACDICGNVEICEGLELNASGTALTCSNCRSRNPEPLRKSLEKHIKREYSTLQINGDSSAEVERALADVGRLWDEETRTWRSSYTDETLSENLRAENLRAAGRQRDPFAPEIDGRFPVFHSGNKDEGLRYHTPGNLEICESFINRLKDQYPPGILHAVAQWVNSNQSEEERQKLLRDMNDIDIVRKKFPRYQVRRLTKQVNKDSWSNTKQELLTCKPLTALSSRKDLKHRQQKYHAKSAAESKRKSWRPRELERVTKVINDIEEHYSSAGKVLRRSDDGCPFPFAGAMPSDWSWWSAWALFAERLERMWLYCNGYWVTIDCVETIYLECIVQFFEPTDVDPLNLRIFSVLYGHPLRFVVAKKHHNQQMRTSFKVPRPTSIADRDPTIGNISIECHIVNQFKSNYPEDTYGAMVTTTRKIKLSKDCFDPTYKSKATTAAGLSDLYTKEDFEAVLDEGIVADAKLFECESDNEEDENDEDSLMGEAGEKDDE